MILNRHATHGMFAVICTPTSQCRSHRLEHFQNVWVVWSGNPTVVASTRFLGFTPRPRNSVSRWEKQLSIMRLPPDISATNISGNTSLRREREAAKGEPKEAWRKSFEWRRKLVRRRSSDGVIRVLTPMTPQACGRHLATCYGTLTLVFRLDRVNSLVMPAKLL